MGNKVDINSVIADIESAIAENGVRADVAEWIAEAESLAKTITIAELDRRCDVHGGVPFIVDNEYMPHCFEGVLKQENISLCGCSLKKLAAPIKSLFSVQVVKQKQLRTFRSASVEKNVP